MASRLHNPAQRRNVWPPQPGLFVMRLAKNAWTVPAQIILSDIGWQAEVDTTRHPSHRDPALAENVALVWHHGRIVPLADWQWFCDVREWAKVNCPDHPALFPYRAIDPNTIPPIPPRRGHLNG